VSFGTDGRSNPAMIVLEPSGNEARRAVGYLASKDAVVFLK